VIRGNCPEQLVALGAAGESKAVAEAQLVAETSGEVNTRVKTVEENEGKGKIFLQ
jgi:hypothetical protein